MNRFVWDLRYAPPPVLRHEYPISALYQNTPGLPLGAMVTPGNYSVRLTVNGRTFEQPLVVGMDPRVDVSADALAQQLTLERKILDLVAGSYEFYKKAVALRQTLAGDQKELEKRSAGGRHHGAERVRPEGAAPARLRRRFRRRRRWPRRTPGAGLRRAESLHRLAGFGGGWAGRRADSGDADRLRKLLPGTGDGSAELERADEDGPGEPERRTGEARPGSRPGSAGRRAVLQVK